MHKQNKSTIHCENECTFAQFINRPLLRTSASRRRHRSIIIIVQLRLTDAARWLNISKTLINFGRKINSKVQRYTDATPKLHHSHDNWMKMNEIPSDCFFCSSDSIIKTATQNIIAGSAFRQDSKTYYMYFGEYIVKPRDMIK